MEISHTEENYLKAIFKISERRNKAASTNAIAKEMSTSAASVTDMVKRLSDKDLIHYERYKGATLTNKGQRIATHLIRKHRLWEVFLVDKLSFSWDEVHEIAEQLEHIKSPKLVERLDAHLGLPKFDPHGDPIPDADGNFAQRSQVLLNEMKPGEKGAIVGVNDHTSGFLQYLDRMQLILGTQVEILECFEYDESVRVRIGADREQLLTKKVSQHLFVQKEIGQA